MIKTAAKFVGGFVLGAILAFVIAYAFGLGMEALNIRLYESEADQQRNYNLFIGFEFLVAMLTGFFATRIGAKNN